LFPVMSAYPESGHQHVTLPCPLSANSGQTRIQRNCPLNANKRHRNLALQRAATADLVLDHSHDYVCLNFGSNLAASVSARDLGGGVVGCGLEFACVSGFDLVA
jgi:hypothetical protein